ncbi:FAD-dependent oxidoreductase [Burkholderia pseudomallei]|nr:FAD-dependent oxidoreductase [Burkholderia pseudomallei]
MEKDSNLYDLIVVGAGMAGHCAALEAANLGGRVLLLEKTDVYGGSTRMCGGAFAFAGTEIQKRNGIEDSSELLEEDLLKAGKYRNDRALVHTYAERQYENYLWLKKLGLEFEHLTLSGSQSVPRNHSISPVRVLDTLHEHYLSAGGSYRANCQVAKLVTEGLPGKCVVVGVETQDGETLLASGGVVIATGGFSRASDLVERFVPHLRDALPMGGYGNTGDGLKMGWALGADLVDIGYVKGSFGAPARAKDSPEDPNAPRLLSAMYKGAIVVNKLGRRFVNESISYKAIGDKCLLQPEAVAFQIFDQSVMAQSSPLPTVSDYRAGLEAGVVVKASSIQELAERLGIDGDKLAKTVQRYNEACDGSIEDEVGRTSLSTGYGKPRRIEEGPFYGIACTTGLTSTYCGLRTDTSARVLTVEGAVIPGLYASGEVTGGFHGETYMSGSSLAKGCVFGRLAAQDAIKRARGGNQQGGSLN